MASLLPPPDSGEVTGLRSPSVSADCRRKKVDVFLPAAGNRWNDEWNNEGSNGNYWSSTLNESNPNNAYNLNFNSGNTNWNNNNRNNGHTVRPVRSTYRFLS